MEADDSEFVSLAETFLCSPSLSPTVPCCPDHTPPLHADEEYGDGRTLLGESCATTPPSARRIDSTREEDEVPALESPPRRASINLILCLLAACASAGLALLRITDIGERERSQQPLTSESVQMILPKRKEVLWCRWGRDGDKVQKLTKRQKKKLRTTNLSHR